MTVRPHHRITNMRWQTPEITLCCILRFLTRNRMVTRVLAKTTKVKNNIKQFKWKEKVEKNTQLSFWWKAKSSSYESAFEDFMLCCELGRHNAWVHHICNGPEAKPSRANAFWFFLSTTMVFGAVQTHFPKKYTRV